jgi:hypothetical protein
MTKIVALRIPRVTMLYMTRRMMNCRIPFPLRGG